MVNGIWQLATRFTTKGEVTFLPKLVRFSDPRGKLNDLVGWLHIEMVYPPKTVTHPSSNEAHVG